MDMTEGLPDDALASILNRLSACDLAASRCIRKTWRAVVGARRLMLPHSLQGIFINYIDYQRPHCLSRPSAQKPLIDRNLDYLPGYTQYFNTIIDHCNGLCSTRRACSMWSTPPLDGGILSAARATSPEHTLCLTLPSQRTTSWFSFQTNPRRRRCTGRKNGGSQQPLVAVAQPRLTMRD
ncbi:hypothetical protein QYE76_035574 [Lolium multiflorum]|uniref:F-box domain-containing protein n=1 Tax=Lolium multiflorum TaxID=4521 RepID=A0AAD8VNL7_LOLMU|nr:hypothetical protein QYE76_035574 [Lolium multiflorum]